MQELVKDTEELTIIKGPADVAVPLTDQEYADTSKAMVILMQQREDLEAEIAQARNAYDGVKNAIDPQIDEKDESISDNLHTLKKNSKMATVEAEYRYDWKKKRLSVFQQVNGEAQEIGNLSRDITPAEHQTLLPLEQRVSIMFRAQDHSILVDGKELVALESFRKYPITADGFAWGKKLVPGMRMAAAAILDKFTSKKFVEKYIDAFSEELLMGHASKEDFKLDIDVGKWVTWKEEHPESKTKE